MNESDTVHREPSFYHRGRSKTPVLHQIHIRQVLGRAFASTTPQFLFPPVRKEDVGQPLLDQTWNNEDIVQ